MRFSSQRGVFIAAGLLASVLCAILLARREPIPEPLVQGKAVSSWALDLNSPSAETRDHAARTVRSFDSNAVPSLVRMLRTRDPLFAKPSRVLERLLPKRISLALARCVNPFQAQAKRAAGAQSLRLMGTNAQSAVPALLNAVEADPTVSWYAALALAQLGEPGIHALTQALERSPLPQCGFICYALGTAGLAATNAIPALHQVLTTRPPDAAERAGAALGGMGRQAVAGLTAALSHTNAAVQITAVKALGSMGSLARESLPKLIELARSGPPAVRATGLEALSQIGPGAESVLGAMTNGLQDPVRAVRLKAIESLGRTTPAVLQASTPALAAALHDESPDVRGHTAILLGTLRTLDPSVLAALQAAARDENDFVQDKVAEALQRLRTAAGRDHSPRNQ